MALHYPDAFNPQMIGLSPLGNNAAEGVTADVVLLVSVNGTPRELIVSNITQTNPVVVYAHNHGLNNNDEITFNFVPGMSQLIGNTYAVSDITVDTFSLYYSS